MQTKFKHFLARDEVDNLTFGDCYTCRETIMRGTEKSTQKAVVVDPPVVGGSETNPIRARHMCRRPEDDA